MKSIKLPNPKKPISFGKSCKFQPNWVEMRKLPNRSCAVRDDNLISNNAKSNLYIKFYIFFRVINWNFPPHFSKINRRYSEQSWRVIQPSHFIEFSNPVSNLGKCPTPRLKAPKTNPLECTIIINIRQLATQSSYNHHEREFRRIFARHLLRATFTTSLSPHAAKPPKVALLHLVIFAVVLLSCRSLPVIVLRNGKRKR